MKITHILTKNFLGARDIDIDIDTPLTVFGGTNFAGKSSLAEAVRSALSGEIDRVGLKKDYPLLVSDGAKRAEIAVGTDHGEASIVLPDAKWAGIPIRTGALQYVLDPARFAALPPEERRTFLFWLTNRGASADEVRQLLVGRGHDSERIESVLPMLRTGFPDACKAAQREATAAKGAWKAVTNATWGKNVAEKWKATKPEYDERRLHALPTSIAAAEDRLASRQKELGALQEKRRQFAEWEKASTGGADASARLTRARAKLATDEKRLQEAQTQLEAAIQAAGDATREGLLHDLARAVSSITVIMADSVGVKMKVSGGVRPWEDFDLDAVADAWVRYTAQYGELGAAGDPDARSRISTLTGARDLMQRSVENDQRDIRELEVSAAAIQLQADVEAISEQDVADARKAVDTAQDELKRLRAEQAQLQAQKLAADTAAANTRKAAQHHADVVAWLALADELDADGIPRELLAGAILPVNVRMAELAGVADWKTPSIDEDMTIRFGGRPRPLLSESEKYRCDAIIALTIALISGLKFALFDRFDVLDIPGRGDLLALLEELADFGDIDSALVFGTLKRDSVDRMRSELSDFFSVHWIDAGVIAAKVPA